MVIYRYLKLFFFSCLTLLLLASCSSSKKERIPEERVHENLKRQYIVTDASSPVRPGWIEDAQIWAREYGRDTKKYRYFSYETEAKVSRSVACSLARAQATADVAREISTFIDRSLVATVSGEASIDQNNPQLRGLRQYVNESLREKVQTEISGARVAKTYWEQRQYQKRLGADKDFRGWTCAAFIEMEQKHLSRLIDFAVEQMRIAADQQTDAMEARRIAEQALNEVRTHFLEINE